MEHRPRRLDARGDGQWIGHDLARVAELGGTAAGLDDAPAGAGTLA